ncbi:MarR family winged helix-turn-helix transcriptional regulator [Vibrio spartinae]|uniref:Multiple antibiotic resistance protein MarR n=1 Tax=Vibrio spartinae TaxID=1918945 RepID=A0ABX6R5R1_9VIBR|nr:MarR family transcriptional regulator [Vibrio spartinae]QMV16888.1 Multiple antibiotic resistance protein MarR [Vibrio spartinae]
MKQDHVERLMMQWQHQCPDIDCFPMGVIGRLSRVNRFISQQRQTVLKSHGMNATEFDILLMLRLCNQSLTPTELYQTLIVSSGGMSTRIERLVQRGWIERIASQSDRRSCKVKITSEGLVLIDKVVESCLAAEKLLLEPLTKEEQEQISSFLRYWLFANESSF